MKTIKSIIAWIFSSHHMLHVAAGAAVCVFIVTTTIFLQQEYPHEYVQWMCLLGCIIAGISADIKDVQWGGSFDIADVLFTILPGFIVWLF